MRPVRYRLDSLAVGEARLRALHALLAPEENAHAHRFRFVQDRERFVARRGLRRLILGELTGTAPERLTFVDGPDGKPRLEGGPCFNASSSGDTMLIVVGDAEVGCDIEAIDPDFDWQPIAAAEFAPDEAAFAVTRADFFRTWARKEACAKALGCGLTVPLASFSTARDTAWIDGQPMQVADLAAGGHAAAVAASGDGLLLEPLELNISVL